MTLDIVLDVDGVRIRIFSYHQIEDELNYNIDVFIEVGNEIYSGTIYTLNNALRLIEKKDLPGYFYDRHGIVIKNLNEKTIIDTIKEMVIEGEVESIFCRQE